MYACLVRDNDIRYKDSLIPECMTSINAAIFILTQNTVERKIYLKTSLYFLFRNFNKKFNYPVIILHEGDYDQTSQEEIIKSIRENQRHLIKFRQIDKEDFEIPAHIDKCKADMSVALQPVPYWRNLKYRLMCYFWVKRFFKYTEGYDYVMRLDDDSIIEEPIKDDLFAVAASKGLVYMSNIVHVDCGLCNYGMKNLFEEIMPACKEQLNNGLFVPAKLTPGNEYFEKFKKLYALIEEKEFTESEFVTEMPIMYYNNFFVTSTKFWKRDDVQEAIKKIDEHGGIFYYRYGDAPLHTILVTLLEPSKISRAQFKYSKRLQREAFIDSSGKIHCYMPKSYDKSSCITDK
jgi:alpha 1,2-mannosyltransferase